MLYIKKVRCNRQDIAYYRSLYVVYAIKHIKNILYNVYIICNK